MISLPSSNSARLIFMVNVHYDVCKIESRRIFLWKEREILLPLLELFLYKAQLYVGDSLERLTKFKTCGSTAFNPRKLFRFSSGKLRSLEGLATHTNVGQLG